MWVEALLLSESFNQPAWVLFPEYEISKWGWILRYRLLSKVRGRISDEETAKLKRKNMQNNPSGLRSI